MKRIFVLLLFSLLLISLVACTANVQSNSFFFEGETVNIAIRSTNGYSYKIDGANISFLKDKNECATGTFYKNSFIEHNKAAIAASYEEVHSEKTDGGEYAIYKCISEEGSPQYVVLVTYNKTSHLYIKSDSDLDIVKTILDEFSVR